MPSSGPNAPGGPDAPGGDPLLLFAVGGTVCALRRPAVRELLPLPRLSAPPGLPRPVAGFLNLGGEAVPVLALARLLNRTEEARRVAGGLYRHIIVLNHTLPRPGGGSGRVALLVDRVLDLVPPPAQPATPPDGHADPCVEAEIPLGAALVHLLAPDRLLREGEAAILAALAEDAQRRLRDWDATPT
ncbi:chemotaxis protein CheW [Roseomonas sp. BN140053]|uniref:chemotaxis protein CheW n=1 Tax=Roseomonas sp. BN140053 TaxID=3391898 RepID=UPI0039ED4948